MLERSFTSHDVRSFAELSCDYNPLHCDALFARRTLYGENIVHGVYLVLWALDHLASETDSYIELRSIKADFKEAIRFDTTCQLNVIANEPDNTRIRIESNGKTAVTLRATWAVVDSIAPITLPAITSTTNVPQSLSREAIINDSGEVPLGWDQTPAKVLFPHACLRMDHAQLATLLACTRVVGMKCPGLHSVYGGLEQTFHQTDQQPTHLTYRAIEFDDRFSLLTLVFETSASTGTSRVFLRPPPRDQIRFTEITQVKAGEFADQRALVVGGSRGIGEVTAKLLAAGGADVRISYYKGESDARRIVNEIVDGGGHADCIRCNVLDSSVRLADELNGWTPTHLYYFATPSIFTATKNVFSADLFDKFCDYYVHGFLRTLDAVQELSDALCGVYYPSSSALDEVIPNMGEYTAAKSAGESMCAFIQSARPALTIVTSRLPRLATDQTQTLIHVDNADPVPVMLNELRQFNVQ